MQSVLTSATSTNGAGDQAVSPSERAWNILPIREHILAYLPQAQQAAALILNKSACLSGVKELYREWVYREDVLNLVGSHVSSSLWSHPRGRMGGSG